MTTSGRSTYPVKSSRDRTFQLKGVDLYGSASEVTSNKMQPQSAFDTEQPFPMKGTMSSSQLTSSWTSLTPSQDRRLVGSGDQFKAKALKEIKGSLERYQRDDGDIDRAMLEKCISLGYDRDVVIETLKANKNKSFEVVLETLNSMTTISGRKALRSLTPGTLQYARGASPNSSALNGSSTSMQRSTPARNLEMASLHKPYALPQQVSRGGTTMYANPVIVRGANIQGRSIQSRPADMYNLRNDNLSFMDGVRLRQKRLDPTDPQKRLSADVLTNMRALEIGEKRRSLEIPNRPPPPYPGYGQDAITESPWLLNASTNLRRIGSHDNLIQHGHPETLARTGSPLVSNGNPPIYNRHLNINGADVRSQSQVPVISGNIPGPSTVVYQVAQHPQQLKDPPSYELATSHKALHRTHSPGDKQLMQGKVSNRQATQAFPHSSFVKTSAPDNQARVFVPIINDKFGSVENVACTRMSENNLTPRGTLPPYSFVDSLESDKRYSLNLEDLEFPPNKRSSVDTVESSIRSDSSASTSPTPDGVERSCSPLPVTSTPHQTLIIHKNGTLEQNFDLEQSRRDLSPFSPRLKSYSPNAFKFYMEQHVENIIKSQEQRKKRRKQLEDEMSRVGLSDEAQAQMRKMLYQKESNYNRLKRAKMNISLFTKIKTLGVGAFGEVSLVRKTDTNVLYAMKILRKSEVLRRNQVAHVKAERDILAEADNEWVVKLYYSFQDETKLYFVMDYIPGGDLMALLIKLGIFSEKLARFYTSELVLALESVHAMGFIHRDIKPDNILIDRTGHIKLTDFGLCTGFRWTHNSKYYQKNSMVNHHRQYSMEPEGGWENHDLPCDCGELKRRFDLCKPLERRAARKHMRCQAHSLVGTPNYIAPEVLERIPYTQLCDWWSVGVILYEMVIGQPPFFAPSPAETQLKVINWRRELTIPRDAKISAEVKDLIMKLCTNASERIGSKGTDEIKRHPFFREVDWVNGPKNSKAPYIPHIKSATDTSNFDPVVDNGTQGGLPDQEAERQIREQGPEHAFYEFTFRSFFDDGGYPLNIYDNEAPSGATDYGKGTTQPINGNKRTAKPSGSSISVPSKLVAPPLNSTGQGEKLPVYV